MFAPTPAPLSYGQMPLGQQMHLLQSQTQQRQMSHGQQIMQMGQMGQMAMQFPCNQPQMGGMPWTRFLNNPMQMACQMQMAQPPQMAQTPIAAMETMSSTPVRPFPPPYPMTSNVPGMSEMPPQNPFQMSPMENPPMYSAVKIKGGMEESERQLHFQQQHIQQQMHQHTTSQMQQHMIQAQQLQGLQQQPLQQAQLVQQEQPPQQQTPQPQSTKKKKRNKKSVPAIEPEKKTERLGAVVVSQEAARTQIERNVCVGRAEQEARELYNAADCAMLAATLSCTKFLMMESVVQQESNGGINLEELNKDRLLDVPTFAFDVVWELPGNNGETYVQKKGELCPKAVGKKIATHLNSGLPVRLHRPISSHTHRMGLNNPIIVTLRRNRDSNGADLGDTYLTRSGRVTSMKRSRQIGDSSSTSCSSSGNQQQQQQNSLVMYATVKRGYGEPPLPWFEFPVVQMTVDSATKQPQLKVTGHIPRATSVTSLQEGFVETLESAAEDLEQKQRSNAVYYPEGSSTLDKQDGQNQQDKDSILMPPPVDVPKWSKKAVKLWEPNIHELIMQKIMQWKQCEKALAEMLQFHFNPNQEPRQPLRTDYPRGLGSTDPNTTGHVKYQNNENASAVSTNGLELWQDCRFCNTKEATHHFFIRCAHCDCEGNMRVNQNAFIDSCCKKM